MMTFIALLAKPIQIFTFYRQMDFNSAIAMDVSCAVFMSAINMNVLNAIGRSDLYLKVDLCKLPLTVVALIITIPLKRRTKTHTKTPTTFLSR
jgi:hypothetical protein